MSVCTYVYSIQIYVIMYRHTCMHLGKFGKLRPIHQHLYGLTTSDMCHKHMCMARCNNDYTERSQAVLTFEVYTYVVAKLVCMYMQHLMVGLNQEITTTKFKGPLAGLYALLCGKYSTSLGGLAGLKACLHECELDSALKANFIASHILQM